MHIITCADCGAQREVKRRVKCKDGCFRCVPCRSKIKSINYRRTEKGREYIKGYNKTEKGKEGRRRYNKSEKGKESQRKYRQSEKRKEYIRKYRQSENGKESQRKYQESEKRKENRREYSKSEKGKAANKKYMQSEKGKEANRRKAKKRYWKDPKYHTVKIVARRHGCYIDLLKKILERDKICQHCSTEENLSFDHIIPVSKGGKAIEDNLQILCRSCNSRKGATIPCA